MIIAGSVDPSELDTVLDIIKISLVTSRIRDIHSVNNTMNDIENKIFEEAFFEDLLEGI